MDYSHNINAVSTTTETTLTKAVHGNSTPGQVVRKVDNAIQRINHYPVDSLVCFVNIYPLDSELSDG